MGDAAPPRRQGVVVFVVPARAAEVVSSNIVGYDKITLAAGYNMVGLQFVQVGGTDLDLSTAIIMDASYDGYNSNYDFANTMRVWTGKGYTTYGWAGTSGTDVDDDPDLDNTWTDLDAEAVIGKTLDAADGVWIYATAPGQVTVSGEVPTNRTIVVNLSAGYNMVCNPFPAATPVTSFGRLDNSFVGYNSNYDFATTMKVWTGKGYTSYGWAGSSGTDVDDDPDLDYTWTDLDAEATSAIIPIGTAVWINAAQAGTITFTNPTAE